MTNLKEAVNELLPHLKEYLQEIGINKKMFNCLNPDHDDKHPSMNLIENSNIVYCHSCKARYSIIDLLGIERGIGPELKGKDFIDTLKYGCEKYNIPFPQSNINQSFITPENYIKNCHNNVYKTNYFKERGISEATIKKFSLGFDEAYKTKNEEIKAVIIPTSDKTYTARNINNNSAIRYHRSYGKSQIFNIKTLENNIPTIIVEGEFDALSLIDAGFSAISLSGVQNTQKLIDACLKCNYSSTLLIALDNDKTGKEQAEKLSEELDYHKIKNKIVYPYDDFKDANEAYIYNRNNLIINLSEQVRKIYKEEVERKQWNELFDQLDFNQRKNISSYVNNLIRKNA